MKLTIKSHLQNMAGIAVLATAAAGCGTDYGAEFREQDTADGGLPSWEAFKAAAARSVDGHQFYVVEWDLGFQSEQALREYYDKRFATVRKSTVRAYFGENPDPPFDVWTREEALSLTYCISSAFGTNHIRARDEVAEATQAWQNVANVRFIYRSDYDSNCTSSDVVVPVTPWSGTDPSPACAFYPSGSGACVPGKLVINFDGIDADPGGPNITSVGVLRHEFGHVLGLAHENESIPNGTVTQCDTGRPEEGLLNEYDSESVMHLLCGGTGNPNTELKITALDGMGLRILYGMPAAWYVGAIL